MADETTEIQDAELVRLREENASLKSQLLERKEQVDELLSTVEELRSRIEALTTEAEEKNNAEFAAAVECHTNAGATGNDCQDANEAVHSEKDSEIARLKKRNNKLEKDFKTLKEKYNSQSKEFLKKANLPTIEKSLKELERLEMQNLSLRACLQGMIQELKMDAKSSSKWDGKQTVKSEPKADARSGARAEEKGDQQILTMSRELRQEFHEDQSSPSSRAVEVEIWTPGEVETEWESLELPSKKRLWADFVPSLSSLEEEMKTDPVAVIQWGEFFVENDRVVKSLQVLNPSSQVSEFVTTDGDVMGGDIATHSFRHFLHPTEPVLFCPGQISVLTVMTRCRVMCEQHTGRRPGYYQLGEVSIESIFDPSALVLIFGLYLKNNDTKQETIFIQLNGRRFCDSKTGRVYESESDVYAGYDRADAKFRWSCLMILIRDGDRIPYCKVPEDIPVTAFTRFGTSVHIERGRVYARNPISNSSYKEGTWIMKKAINSFDLQLMKSMRR